MQPFSRWGERSAHYVDAWIWRNHTCDDPKCRILPGWVLWKLLKKPETQVWNKSSDGGDSWMTFLVVSEPEAFEAILVADGWEKVR